MFGSVINQVSDGETIDANLWAVVDGVLRGNTGENGKLVSDFLSHTENVDVC